MDQLWDRADLGTSCLTPQAEIKVYLEIRFNFRSVLLDFQSFNEKLVFEYPCACPMILFLSYLVKNSIYRVSVICKLAMEWYLMRMCVPRGRAPFGQHQESRPLAMSNTGSPGFTDFPSFCACSESSLTNLICSGLNLLCLHKTGMSLDRARGRDSWR